MPKKFLAHVSTFLFALLLLTPLTVASGGDHIIYAVNQEADTFDLHEGSSRYDLIVGANVFDTYVYETEDGEFLPWLAEEVTMSDDARTYTIRLREGITFHDGTPLNAEAVQFNFDRIVDPETASRKAIGDMGSYERTEVIDELTVEVHFSEPHPGFWFALAEWRAGGPHSPTALREDPDSFLEAPVGTGPFKVVEWVQQSHVTLEAFEDYDWPHPRTDHTGRAKPDRVTVRLIPEDGSRVTALRTGEVHGAMRIPPQNVASLRDDPEVYIMDATLPGTGVLLIVNATKAPTDDPAVRQALQHLVGQDQISATGYFEAWPQHQGSVLSEPNLGFIDLSEMYPFDLEGAAQILDDAGWELGNDGIRQKDGVRLVLDYIGFPSPETTRTMELIQALGNAIGLDITILELDGPAIQQARRDGDHNIAHLTFIFRDPGFLRTLFHSENIGGGWNFTHWPDEQLDALLEAGEIEADLDDRIAIYHEVQEYLYENTVVVPLVYQQQVNAWRTNVHGVELYEVYGEAPYFYAAYLEE